MERLKVAIIGSGNIGMDLMYKLRHSDILECSVFIGRNPKSENLLEVANMGIPTSSKSIKYIAENPQCCDIVFDATDANSHKSHAPILKKLKKYVIDLTPSHVGKMCIPCINTEECLHEANVNMITCGGQSMVPIAYIISKVCEHLEYIETVSTIASKSAGSGTRGNIDEYVNTTSEALKYFSGADKAKAMIVLNPAEPPVSMRNTLYAKVKNPDLKQITDAIYTMEKNIQSYITGYKIIVEPILLEDIITVTIQVKGKGDYLPDYAGNLDIITCSAVEMAERYAKEIIRKEAWQF